MKPASRRSFRLVLLLSLLLSPGIAWADDGIPAKAALCVGCHGADGKPANKSIPVIWGQNEGYLYLELRDYKVGNRTHPVMSVIAGNLEKADMKALAAYFAAKPWLDLRQPTAGDDVVRHAETVAGSAQCPQCHLSGYVGDSTVPRLADQGVDYLRSTMNAFRSNDRKNNSWMTALLKTYTDADIDALAHYLAGL